MSPFWAITQEKIEAAVERVVNVAQPSRVILFGSAAQDQKNARDVDLLVVTHSDVESPRKESVRIRRELRGISMPMDILVVSEQRLEALSNQPGLVYREALRNGKVLYESSS